MNRQPLRPSGLPAVIAAVMLLAALGSWPYGYFVLLRWVVCAVAVVIAYWGYPGDVPWLLWLFGFIALLFNPIVPVSLTRDIWLPIDIVAAVLFLIAARSLAYARSAMG